MAKAKILIVDDEPFNVDYLEQELEGPDYETTSAFNGREALDLIQANPPDLVLLDIMMPVMDGFEVLSHLKANPSTRDIPVIVISADSNLRSVVKGIQMGAEDYLPKPFEPTLLFARISSSLEKKRLRDLQKLYLKSLEREFDIAREIQLGFLPSELPQVGGWEIEAYFKAAREVAGDFYDVFLLPDGDLVCVVGDVCGKGVGAALFMTLFRSLIRATSTTDYFNNKVDPPGLNHAERLQHVISFTNNYVAETHDAASMFATVFIFIVDPQTGKLTYMNCGNEPAFIIESHGNITALRPTGPIVGVIPDAAFTPKELWLQPNDLILAYTDGVTDALNADEVSFGKERLLSVLPGLLNTGASPGTLLEKITAELQQFTGEAEQFDDITLLALKRSA